MNTSRDSTDGDGLSSIVNRRISSGKVYKNSNEVTVEGNPLVDKRIISRNNVINIEPLADSVLISPTQFESFSREISSLRYPFASSTFML